MPLTSTPEALAAEPNSRPEIPAAAIGLTLCRPAQDLVYINTMSVPLMQTPYTVTARRCWAHAGFYLIWEYRFAAHDIAGTFMSGDVLLAACVLHQSTVSTTKKELPQLVGLGQGNES